MLTPSITREKQHPQSLRSRRRRKSGRTNRGCWTLKWDLLLPSFFGTNGGIWADCNCFLKRLAEKLSEDNVEPDHITITWIRKLLSFEILRSVNTCVRGSRTPFQKIPQILHAIRYCVLLHCCHGNTNCLLVAKKLNI